jgi:hypothetical protein
LEHPGICTFSPDFSTPSGFQEHLVLFLRRHLVTRHVDFDEFATPRGI